MTKMDEKWRDVLLKVVVLIVPLRKRGCRCWPRYTARQIEERSMSENTDTALRLGLTSSLRPRGRPRTVD